jgi:hypothetical protein
VRRVLLAVVFAVLACKPSSKQQGFRLRIALIGPLSPVTPGAEPSDSEYALYWVFSSLLRTAPDGSPIPGLAARFRFSSPARVVLELREGARFSDGSAVTAEDVRRSLQQVGLEVREQPPELVIESPSGAAIKAGDWARAMHELRDDSPMALICRPDRLALIDSRIKNPRIDEYDYLESLPEWEIEQ